MRFRFVDRITAWEPMSRIAGSKTVSFEEYSLNERLGLEPALPRTLVLESFFQLGNWLIVLSSGFTRMGLIIRTESIAFESDVRPGDRLEMEARVISWREDGVLFSGTGSVGGRVVTVGKGCLAVPASLADYHDPKHLEVLFSEIYRPEA